MAEPKDFRIGCEFYLSVALKAANDLRAALRIDEESFRRIASIAWQDPRPAFLYRVLDEVQKAGIAIKDWSDKLGEGEWKPEYTEHLVRLVTQWQQDEQRFRARKLSEALIDLICFSQTNEPEYYRDSSGKRNSTPQCVRCAISRSSSDLSDEIQNITSTGLSGIFERRKEMVSTFRNVGI